MRRVMAVYSMSMRLLGVRGRWLVCRLSWRGGTIGRICNLCWGMKRGPDYVGFTNCVWRMSWRPVATKHGLLPIQRDRLQSVKPKDLAVVDGSLQAVAHEFMGLN